MRDDHRIPLRGLHHARNLEAAPGDIRRRRRGERRAGLERIEAWRLRGSGRGSGLARRLRGRLEEQRRMLHLAGRTAPGELRAADLLAFSPRAVAAARRSPGASRPRRSSRRCRRRGCRAAAGFRCARAWSCPSRRSARERQFPRPLPHRLEVVAREVIVGLARRLLCSVPNSSGDMSRPSMTGSAGTLAAGERHAASAADRWCRRRRRTSLPGAILPGHQARVGSRTPPSHVLPLPPRNGPALAAVRAFDEPRPVVAGEDHQRVFRPASARAACPAPGRRSSPPPRPSRRSGRWRTCRGTSRRDGSACAPPCAAGRGRTADPCCARMNRRPRPCSARRSPVLRRRR